MLTNYVYSSTKSGISIIPFMQGDVGKFGYSFVFNNDNMIKLYMAEKSSTISAHCKMQLNFDEWP